MSGRELDVTRRSFVGLLLSTGAVLATVAVRPIFAADDAPADPWTAAQTVQPAALAKELADAKPADKPTVVCVAPHAMYIGGHIPGALYHGPGGKPEGIDDLKKWAQPVPRADQYRYLLRLLPHGTLPESASRIRGAAGYGLHARARSAHPHEFLY